MNVKDPGAGAELATHVPSATQQEIGSFLGFMVWATLSAAILFAVFGFVGKTRHHAYAKRLSARGDAITLSAGRAAG
jgi:hypothetical protein